MKIMFKIKITGKCKSCTRRGTLFCSGVVTTTKKGIIKTCSNYYKSEEKFT
jgi:hypothetical protein